MGKYNCCVPLCPYWKNHAPIGTTWHVFPKDPNIRGQWFVKIRRANYSITKHTFVCSNHFTKNDFRGNLHTKRKYLKPSAVPTIFPWTDTNQTAIMENRHKRCQARSKKKELASNGMNLSTNLMEDTAQSTNDTEMEENQSHDNFEDHIPTENNEDKMKDLEQDLMLQRSQYTSLQAECVKLKTALDASVNENNLLRQETTGLKKENLKITFYGKKLLG